MFLLRKIALELQILYIVLFIGAFLSGDLSDNFGIISLVGLIIYKYSNERKKVRS